MCIKKMYVSVILCFGLVSAATDKILAEVAGGIPTSALGVMDDHPERPENKKGFKIGRFTVTSDKNQRLTIVDINNRPILPISSRQRPKQDKNSFLEIPSPLRNQSKK